MNSFVNFSNIACASNSRNSNFGISAQSRLHGLALQRIGRYDAATEQFAACYKAAHALGDRRTKCIALLERGVASGNFRL